MPMVKVSNGGSDIMDKLSFQMTSASSNGFMYVYYRFTKSDLTSAGYTKLKFLDVTGSPQIRVSQQGSGSYTDISSSKVVDLATLSYENVQVLVLFAIANTSGTHVVVDKTVSYRISVE